MGLRINYRLGDSTLGHRIPCGLKKNELCYKVIFIVGLIVAVIDNDS